jgi:signal transduction histidine kinase
MTLLPFELAFPISAALAVFGIGCVAWWSNKWSRGNVLFALMAFTLALWTSVDWFRDLEATALPVQVIVWRMLFYVSVALAPALALHLTTILARRPLGFWGGAAYVVAILQFILLDSAFLLRAIFDQSMLGMRWLDIGAQIGLVFHIAIFFIAATMMYPILHHRGAPMLERRRATYGLLLIITYLFAGASQFVSTAFPPFVFMTIMSAIFFILAAAAFIRTRLLEINFVSLEALFVVLAAGAVVTILRASTFTEGVIALVGAAFIGFFGVRAIRVVRDEERRRHELERINFDLVKLDEARRDLVAAVAHQLRGPLGGIRFTADMFVRGDYGPMNDKAKNVMTHVRTSADRLLALAETSLNAARLEAGLFHSVVGDVDVKVELLELVANLELTAETKGIELRTELEKLPPKLQLDREGFRNALFNIIDNAIKYTEAGSVTIKADTDTHTLHISVSDTGAGISREDLKKLFGRFARGEEGKKRSTDGSGLGLYVSKKLIEEMGGTITAHSEGLGKGATFRIEIPLRG